VICQNWLVRRRFVLALGLSALLWTATAGTSSVLAGDIVTTSEVAPSQVAGDPQGPSDSDQQWRAQRHTIAAVTESVWKAALVHAGLAATPSALLFDTTRPASWPNPPVRSVPHYLRHTPLLI
jgi:hypothetical protein